MSLLIYCIVAVLFAAIFGRAKRSAKLFWLLIASFCVGAIGAAIFTSCEDVKGTNDVEKKAFTSMNAGVQKSAIVADIAPVYIALFEQASTSQKQSYHYDIIPVSHAASSSDITVRGNFVNLLNPGLVFKYFDTS